LKIDQIDAHAGPRLTALRHGHSGLHAGLLESPTAFSVGDVVKQEVGLGVIGDEQIRPPILITSQTATPRAFPGLAAIPVAALTSRNHRPRSL